MKVRTKRTDGGFLIIFQGIVCGILLACAGCGADAPSETDGVAKSAQEPMTAAVSQVEVKPAKTDPVAARKQLAELGVSYTVGDFIAAAVNGDQVAVTLFLDAGMDVNTRDQRDHTAVIAAATFGHRSIVELLLARGADPALPGVGLNALTLAVEADEPAIATLFLDDALKDNQEVKDVALVKAVTLDRAEMATLLVDKGASVHQIDEPKGVTLIMKTASRGFDKVLQVLLPASTNINAVTDDGFTAVDYACSRIDREYREEGKITVEENYTLKRTGERVLADPCYKLLVAAGAKPITPSYVERRSEYIGRELQPALLEIARAEARSGGENFMMYGKASGMIIGLLGDLDELRATSTDFIKPLVSSCEAAGRARFTHATTVSSTGPTEEEKLTTRLLMSYQVELWTYAGLAISNAVASENLKPDTLSFERDETLLMKAVSSGNTNLVDQLVRAGADPNRKSQDGLSALSLATRLKSEPMLKTLNAGNNRVEP